MYPMGAWEPLLPPLGPSGLEYPSESDLVVSRSSSPRDRDSSRIDYASTSQNLHRHMEYGQFTSPFGTVDPRLHDFLDFELPSDEAILEAMTTVSISRRTYTVVFVFFPFGRLPKLTIEETLGLSLAVGST
jgi:hypothetical protein